MITDTVMRPASSNRPGAAVPATERTGKGVRPLANWYGAPICAGWFADRQMGPSLLQFGTPEQRRQWLPGIVSGESMWCVGTSEPDAGSGVASLRTRAERNGDDWIVTGQKVWTSGAAHAPDWCYRAALTDPDAPKQAALSELIIDLSSPGIEVPSSRT